MFLPCHVLSSQLSSIIWSVWPNGRVFVYELSGCGFKSSCSHSILSPLLFLICINDLPNKLKSNAKLFADDTCLFTAVKDKNESDDTLDNAISLISKWSFSWQMLFNWDPCKQVQEVLFSRKKKLQFHRTISLNNIQIERASYQKHLDILIDEKLNLRDVDITILIVNVRYFCNKKLSIICDGSC